MEIGILVTHGTDTLAWTFPFIRYALKDFSWNVCLTGSQFPMERAFAWSDGYQNVHGAVRFLAVLEPPNVFAVFNNGHNAYADSLAKVERWRGGAFIGDPIATMEWDEVQHRAGDARLRDPVVLDELHLVTTGGTIDSGAGPGGPAAEGLRPGQGMVEEFIRMSLPCAARRVVTHALPPIDSAEVDLRRMELLARTVFNCRGGSAADPADVRNPGAGAENPGERRPRLDLEFTGGVRLVYCDPFRSAEDYCEAVEHSRAVVLAGYGGGNASADPELPGNALKALHLADEQGKLFVLSSQVPIGPADFVYKTARRFIREGALSGVELSLPECQVRLMYILGHEEQVKGMAQRIGCQPGRLLKTLFMSGMKFRNRESRENFLELSGGRIPLVREDLLVGRPFEELEKGLAAVLGSTN